MPSLNRVQLIGRLGKDPESKYTPTGKKVCHFSLAVSNRWKDKNGETKESTEWVNIEAWGRLGEICQEYLKKGSLIFVEGRLKTDKYEDRENGETKYFTKVVSQSLQFLDKKEKDEPMMAVEEEPGEYELAGE
ncbi:MAG: single-stranded DNA-binding protein [Anaerolineales bacterium]|uniref:single-stranded DNA-binding protein n=1 Tax=Candidatus Villigracilis vicinus TaxID=3140679 RepID=UPI003134B97B|nr:single-stranded DNA-binding protein [Anaerolineales bacterium]